MKAKRDRRYGESEKSMSFGFIRLCLFSEDGTLLDWSGKIGIRLFLPQEKEYSHRFLSFGSLIKQSIGGYLGL